MSWMLVLQIMVLMLWTTVCINGIRLPKGPKGDKGDTGPVGPIGENGLPGKDHDFSYMQTRKPNQ